MVLVDYSWKMPRVDAVALDADGYLHRVRGVSTAFNPLCPRVADGPSADMPFRSDFVKVLILRDMELGQTG